MGGLQITSGKFTANAAWLVLAVMAFNLPRAAGTLAGPTMAKATTATIRRKIVHVPARIASSARRLTLHLPSACPGKTRGPPSSPDCAHHHQQSRGPDQPPT